MNPRAENATQVQLCQPVEKTPGDIISRYRENRNWRLYQKEWIYRNFPPAGQSWLDFGCGTGEITTQLAILGATRVVGMDVTPGLIDITRRRSELDGVSDRVQLICADIREVEPEPVDVVLAFAVLHHLPDHLNDAIPAMRRWLKPGGTFICVEPISYLEPLEWLRQYSGAPHDALDPGERKLTESDLRCIESKFSTSERHHFHCFARLGRVFPRADRLFRRIDSAFLRSPVTKPLAGSVVQICRV